MVRSLTAAAGRQACIFAGSKRGREGAKREEKNQQDGERAPHLGSMVHEVSDMRNGVSNPRPRRQVSSSYSVKKRTKQQLDAYQRGTASV
jgi:hypothetical protein